MIRMHVPSQRESGRGWRGTAFLVEALVLLAFLIAALALFTQVFARTGSMAEESAQLTQATVLASNMAERFCAEPDRAPDAMHAQGLTAVCSLYDGHRSSARAGQLTRISIAVIDDATGAEVYRLDTERYVPDAYTPDADAPDVASDTAGESHGA